MLVGTVRVLMADEISTGLDSATTFSIVARLKSFMAMRPTFLVCRLFTAASGCVHWPHDTRRRLRCCSQHPRRWRSLTM